MEKGWYIEPKIKATKESFKISNDNKLKNH